MRFLTNVTADFLLAKRLDVMAALAPVMTRPAADILIRDEILIFPLHRLVVVQRENFQRNFRITLPQHQKRR